MLNNLHAYEPSGNVSPSGSTWLPPVYYTGKGSLRYKDEVLHITNYSTETGERKYSDKAEAQAEYKNYLIKLSKQLQEKVLMLF